MTLRIHCILLQLFQAVLLRVFQAGVPGGAAAGVPGGAAAGVPGGAATGVPPVGAPGGAQAPIPGAMSVTGIKLFEEIKKHWGDKNYNAAVYDRNNVTKYASYDGMISYMDQNDPDNVEDQENGFDLYIHGNHKVSWRETDPASGLEKITGTKKGFEQNDADAMIALSRMRGWKDFTVNGKTEHKEMLWLAVQKMNWKEQRLFEHNNGTAEGYVQARVINFNVEQTSVIYGKWLEEKALLEQAYPRQPAAPAPAPVPAAPATAPTPAPTVPTPAPTAPTPAPTAPTPAPTAPTPVAPAPAPTAPAAVTPAAVTPAPVTPAPVTPVPVTPVTPAPVTPAAAAAATVALIDDVGINAAVDKMKSTAITDASKAPAALAAPSAFGGLKMQADLFKKKLAKTAATIFEDKNAPAASAVQAATPALIASALAKLSSNNALVTPRDTPAATAKPVAVKPAATTAATMAVVAPAAAATTAAIARLTTQERTDAIDKHNLRKHADTPKIDPFKNEGVSAFFERNDFGKGRTANPTAAATTAPTTPVKSEKMPDENDNYHINSGTKIVIKDPRNIERNKNKPKGRHP